VNDLNNEDYMRMALELAKKGCGNVSPNPMVGAVVVKDGRIIGKGYHEQYGGLHAERNALKNCTEDPRGSVMYVTLEPCCHYGKQPPCVNAVIDAGIKEVFIGSGDPNPLVAGKGVKILKDNGIKVNEGVLREECDKINEVFFHYIKTKLPYVVMKYAMSADGKIASYTGASKWITGEKARENVHYLRRKYTAIMAGAGTVLADNPMLTCRMENGKNPVRIICDTHLRTPLTSNIVSSANEVKTIIATCADDADKIKQYTEKGCEIVSVSEKNGHVNLKELMNILGERGIDSILLEGGAELNWSAIESGIVSKVLTYIAPKLIGGSKAKSPIGGRGFAEMSEVLHLKNSKVTQIGEDFLIESEADYDVHGNS
jgi:diaminohydroxyphosphoribosylaminopyrimidine deaminase/5-amino-6-(5-phosphoribosylamino)uracil reductase